MAEPTSNSCAIALPGSVGLTHLRVYETAAPDGLVGGSPHLHFACTECYYVVAGRGSVQTLSVADGYREIRLEPGALVWFTPGTVHRLINDGGLEIFVVMQNSGLPEAGDFVLTMPRPILSDPNAYFEAAMLSANGTVFAAGADAAMRRRDLAVRGFADLRRRIEESGGDGFEQFYALAARLVRPNIDTWRGGWSHGALAEATETGEFLSALSRGDISHLLRGRACSIDPPEERKLGMCGELTVYLPEGRAVASPDSGRRQ